MSAEYRLIGTNLLYWYPAADYGQLLCNTEYVTPYITPGIYRSGTHQPPYVASKAFIDLFLRLSFLLILYSHAALAKCAQQVLCKCHTGHPIRIDRIYSYGAPYGSAPINPVRAPTEDKTDLHRMKWLK